MGYVRIYNVAMHNLRISDAVLQKLRDKHSVERSEVEQCFLNLSGKLLIDNRPIHKTNPPTLWFIACTNKGRMLKVAYIQKEQIIHLRSAFEPNDAEIAIYKRWG